MVSYIRIIAAHLIGPNNLWDIIKKLNVASVLRPPPAKPWRRLYCQCEPSAVESSVEGTTNQNIVTWLVAHGTNLRIRSRLGDEAGRMRLRGAWQQRCALLSQLGWGRRSLPPGKRTEKPGAGQSGERLDYRGWQAYWNALLFKLWRDEGNWRHLQLMGNYSIHLHALDRGGLTPPPEYSR